MFQTSSGPLVQSETVAIDVANAEITARDLRNYNWVVTLDEHEAKTLTEAAQAVMTRSYIDDPEAWVTEAQLQAAHLPEGLRRRLITFRRFSNERGALLIKNLPIGEIPPTPVDADNNIAPTLLATATTSVIVAALGDQYGFKPELGGKLFQSILPIRTAERTQRSVGSKVYLEDHIEMCFTEFRADFVVLTCVRADHEGVAGTALASINDILPLLDKRTIEILRQPRFRTTVDESFLVGWGEEDKTIWVDPIRVLEGAASRPRMRVDFAETVGKDDEAQVALDALKEAVQEARQIVLLKPGEMLITDNVTAMHGRTPFTPRYDNQDRWLLRTFVTKDLSRSLEVRSNDGRVVDPDYQVWLNG